MQHSNTAYFFCIILEGDLCRVQPELVAARAYGRELLVAPGSYRIRIVCIVCINISAYLKSGRILLLRKTFSIEKHSSKYNNKCTNFLSHHQHYTSPTQ